MRNVINTEQLAKEANERALDLAMSGDQLRLDLYYEAIRSYYDVSILSFWSKSDVSIADIFGEIDTGATFDPLAIGIVRGSEKREHIAMPVPQRIAWRFAQRLMCESLNNLAKEAEKKVASLREQLKKADKLGEVELLKMDIERIGVDTKMIDNALSCLIGSFGDRLSFMKDHGDHEYRIEEEEKWLNETMEYFSQIGVISSKELRTKGPLLTAA